MTTENNNIDERIEQLKEEIARREEVLKTRVDPVADLIEGHLEEYLTKSSEVLFDFFVREGKELFNGEFPAEDAFKQMLVHVFTKQTYEALSQTLKIVGGVIETRYKIEQLSEVVGGMASRTEDGIEVFTIPLDEEMFDQLVEMIEEARNSGQVDAEEEN